jgi:hypothetical protein
LDDLHRTEPAHAHRSSTLQSPKRPLFDKNVALFTN